MKDFICKKCGNTTYIVQEKSNGTGVATGLYCEKCGTWHKWLNKQEKVLYSVREKSDKDKEIVRLIAENAELRARLDKAVELPARVMIGTLVDKKIKIKKEQAFNWKIGEVYRDETRWNGLLVDVCSEKGGKNELYTVVII